MDERCAIETSGHVDIVWLCQLWVGYPDDRSAMIHGFHQMSTFDDSHTRDELVFLQDIALRIEADEAGHGYH